MRVVLDTNVVVSGLLSATTPPGRVVESALSGDLVLLYDERMLEEYTDVLGRPRFRFDPRDIGWLLTVVRLGEPVVAAPLPLTVPDPDDLKFVEVAVAAGADAIVTGNARHFKLAEGRLAVPVVSPRRFIEMLRNG